MSVGAEDSAQDGGASARERFESWRDLVGRTRVAEATSAHADEFTAQLRRLDLGPLVLLGSSFPSARFRRTKGMIERSDQGLYYLTLLTSGVHGLRRGRDQSETFRAGDLALIDSSTPHDVHMVGEQHPGGGWTDVACVSVDLPASLLPVPPHRLRDLLGRRLSGREGTGALLTDFLLGLNRQGPGLRAAEAARLGEVAVDLVSAWVARELDAGDAVSPEARARATVEAVRAFIRRNLHDPDLTPPTIAAAHHISVSHLHRLFAQHSPGQSVAALIRSQRLAKAHRELADPALRALPVLGIAARCGMPRASDFGRAFKAAYGLTPREHRQQACTGQGWEGTVNPRATGGPRPGLAPAGGG